MSDFPYARLADLLATGGVSSCALDQQHDMTLGVDGKSKAELRDFLRVLVDIAATAALPYFRRGIAVENKDVDGFDPVTIADRQTEDAIRDAIMERYPDHGIIGEEREELNPDARYRWVIDPIDGTKAYLCGLPTWATLVGLCDETSPILGMMSQPLVGEYFIGGFGEVELVGRDARTSLRTSAVSSLAGASLFATSPDMFSAGEEFSQFNALSSHVRLTRFGVDSYAYCLLAAGFIDIVAEAGLGFYDIAALIPIVEAAGGIITDWGGAPVRGGGRVLAAANPELHAAALNVLSR
jgi:myo-inositol-1(or 4)-monophosphatase